MKHHMILHNDAREMESEVRERKQWKNPQHSSLSNIEEINI